MKGLTIAVLLLAGTMVFAQDLSTSSKKAIKNYEKATQYFRQKQDAQAEQFLWEAVGADNEFIEAWFMLAQIYLDKKQGAKAAKYYLNGLEVDPDTYGAGYLKVADLEFSIGEYYLSREHLEKWKSYNYSDAKALALATKLELNLSFAIDAINNPLPFNPMSLGPAINTTQYEYWPSLSIDESRIFFTVLGKQNEKLAKTRLDLQEDFYFAIQENGKWKDRTYLGAPVNTNSNEGAQTVTADGKYIYFTACNRPDGHGRMCDLYYSRVDETGKWSKPVNLGDVVNTTASEKHPSVSADGRMLVFASNKGGGEGSYDIWMTKMEEGSWQKPVNLGDSINSQGMEQSPFLHPDQRTLYFSSDGWPGMGKGDIFMSKLKDDGTWSSPKNLGFPINTFNEEVGFIVNASGREAYYSSNRRDGTDTDIYKFEIPEEIRPNPVSYIKGRVYDSRTMKGIEALFQLVDLNTGELVVESASNPGEGDYLVSLPTGSSYLFNVSQRGYLFYSDHFALSETYSQLDPMKMDIPLEPIRAGKSVILNNIFYETDSYDLKDHSLVELDKIYDFLSLNKNVKVEISGHTDNVGSSQYNHQLSNLRADAVVRYLEGKGIEAERLVSEGYGDTAPIGTNDTEEGRAKNRRTELKIVSIGK